MNKMDASLENAATVCAVCHDQCVSACPVVEATRRMSAYPSRLAMLALELNRGGLSPSADLARSLQDCISCGACLEGCLYVDQPNDVTPVVRWARQATSRWTAPGLNAWVDKVRSTGSPYEDTRERLAALEAELPGSQTGELVLLYVDAATLHYAPEMAVASIRLLRQLGYQNLRLAEEVYPGGELREQGWPADFAAVAKKVAGEVKQVKPVRIITVHPNSAYLLRKVYPAEAGIRLDAPVFALPEVLEAHSNQLAPPGDLAVYLIQSAVESYRMGGGAGRKLLEALGVRVFGQRADLPYREMTYPDGEIFGIEPDPRDLIRERIVNAFHRSGASKIVTSSPEAFAGLHAAHSDIEVIDLATYFLR